MFISFNTQSILIPKIQPIKKEYNAKANIVNTPADFVSFEGNANYKNTKSIMYELGKSKRIAILSHKDADADAISSGILFLEFLKRKFKDKGKDIKFIINQEIPKYCSKIPNVLEIVKYKDLVDKNFDSVVVLDCDETRVDCFDIYKNARKKINIDHHRNNKVNINFPKNLCVISPESVSTTQVIYDNFFLPFGEFPNQVMTECIMTGIVSDTGNFRHIFNRKEFDKTMDSLAYQSKTPLSLVAKKVNENFDAVNKKSNELENFYTDTIETRKNIKEFVSKSGKKVHYVLLDRDLINKYQIKDKEPEIKGTINHIVAMNRPKADITAVLWEKESGEIRLSMRSNKIDLLEIVEKFGGGGHKLAAGASLKGTPDEALKELLDVIDNL